MKALFRDGLILTGIVAGAVASGIVLGNFTQAGITGMHAPTSQMAKLERFAREREAARTARQSATAAAAAEPAPFDEDRGDHVCEGCDARQTRDRQLAAMLGFSFDDPQADVRGDRAPGAPRTVLPELPDAASHAGFVRELATIP